MRATLGQPHYRRGMEVRELTTADAATVARIHVAAWRVGYNGLMPSAVLDALDIGERTEMWSELLSQPDPGARFLAEYSGSAVGFVVGARESPFADGEAEVFSIYVDPAAWRVGAGSALLDAAVGAIRADGPRPVILWVLDGNERACRFYESRGWYFDGGRKDEMIQGHAVAHLRYRLDPS